MYSFQSISNLANIGALQAILIVPSSARDWVMRRGHGSFCVSDENCDSRAPLTRRIQSFDASVV